jgi:tRNA threonylcarbamoyladenosine biosynthesis protein TsaB
MLVLALDTTTRVGSTALVDNDRIIAERAGDGSRTHAERLPRELLALVTDSGRALADVDVYAVAAGPGSFTGLRIGIATMQGLAFVSKRPMIGVSALEALGRTAASHPDRALVAAWMDAHRGEVFAALYRAEPQAADASPALNPVEEATVGDPAEILARWRTQVDLSNAVFVGDGAVVYRDVIMATFPEARVVTPGSLAGEIGRIAAACALAGEGVPPAGVRPLYVRRPDAVLERERRSCSNG